MKSEYTLAVTVCVLSTLLWVGCYDTGGEDAVQLAVTNAQTHQVGDTFWVDVQLDGVDAAAAPLTSVNFTLHYTNSHVRLLQHEPGALAVSSKDYQAANYPSNAEVDVGVSVDSARLGTAAPTLARFQFRADDVTTDEAPAYLSFSGITAYDAAGNQLVFDGPPARLAIRPTPGTERTPELQLFTQHAVQNELTVKRVTLDQPGWIVVRPTDSDAEPPPIVAQTWVEAGTHENVTIMLDDAFGLAEQTIARLEATLHRDTGAPKQFEYGGPDAPDPPVRRAGTPVTTSFFAQYTASTPQSSITVQNQQLTRRTLLVEEVVVSEPADLVIHRGRRDRPFIPGIIGKTRVEPGTNRNVEVPIYEEATIACGETLWPMLHVRSESSDQPYEIDHPLITRPATILCE